MVLSGLDLAITRIAIGRGAREVNPLLAPVIEGSWAPLLKTAGVGLIALVLLWREDRDDRRLTAVVLLYAAVVVWNTVTVLAKY